MTWFKVDDKHHDHRKTRKALRGVKGKRRDASPMGLWELAGSWSADNLTDGFVPTDELFRWDDDWEALAGRLVDCGYWETAEHDGEPGFQFINWEDHQPMKVEVEAKREAARERMRNLRSGSQGTSGEVRANKPRSSPSSSVTPSRPVPSLSKENNNDAFEEFWIRYPRKIAKGAAKKAWTAAAKKADPDTIVNAARSFAVRSAGSDPKFIPYPATWLNGERWADELETQKSEAKGGWFQPFNPGEPPRDIADDPEKYAAWLEDRRNAWRQENGQ